MARASELRTAIGGRTTPDRLRRVAAVLLVACLLAAAVSLASGAARSAAVADGGGRIAGLTAGSAQLYRALADADAMATSGYVSGGIEPTAVRARYDGDITRASTALVAATGRLAEDDPVLAAVATITQQLPEYTGLVESARVYNRQGLPLGQSYLSRASTLMTATILPAAGQLRSAETAALRAAYADAAGPPFVPLLVVFGALAALADVSVRELRRTHRVLSPGLVVAAVALVAALLWWAVAGLVAGSALTAAARHADVADLLDDASAVVLQARSTESLVLVARSGGGDDAGFGGMMAGTDGLLTAAALAADDDPDPDPGSATRTRVDEVRVAVRSWEAAHAAVRELDDGGRYAEAVAAATGSGPGSSRTTFDRLDAALLAGSTAERQAFGEATGTAGAALAGLAVGPAVLAVLAAAGAVAGIGRRIGEYR